MGNPTNTAELIDDILQAQLDKIVEFTDEIKSIADGGILSVPTNFPGVSPVQSVRSLGTVLGQNQPSLAARTDNTAAFRGTVAPTVSSRSIEQLSVPAPPTAPDLDLGTPPVTNLPSVPPTPTLQTTVIPVKPDLSIPSVPSLANINIPALVVPVLPTFDQSFPEVPDDLMVPVDSFTYSEEDYISTELTNLRNLINNDLENGGWGIDGHQDEEDLFERQRARMQRELIVQEEELFDSFAARGFSVPQGDQIDQVRVLQKQTIDKLQETNLDISTKRADLIRASRENVISQANTLNQTMVTYRGFMQQRLLQAAEFLAGHSINLFNAKVNRHNLVITAYNSFVGAYQAQVNAAVSQIEVSKLELEAEALKSTINKSTIDLYQAQIDSVTSLVQMYQIEVNASKVLSDIERNKLSIFQTEIDSYKAQIDAEVSKSNLYATQLGAEELKSRIFQTNVSAYDSEIRAKLGAQQSFIEEANLSIKEDALRLEAYRSDIDRYRADIEQSSANLRASSDKHSTDASVYGSYISSYASYISSLVAEENVEVGSSLKRVDVQSQNLRANSELWSDQAKLQADAAIAAARIYSGYAEAYSQVNSMLDVDIL